MTALAAAFAVFLSVKTFSETQKQFEIQNRPYLGFDTTDFNFDQEGKSGDFIFEVGIPLKNYGNRPAYYSITVPVDSKIADSNAEVGGLKPVTPLTPFNGNIMPGQIIKISWKQTYFYIGPFATECDFTPLLERQQVEVQYGDTAKNLKYKTVLKRGKLELPTGSVSKGDYLFRTPSIENCPSAGVVRIFPWTIESI